MIMADTYAEQKLPRADVRIYAGRPIELRVNLQTGAGGPLPAAGVTSARAQVRQNTDDATVWHTFSTEDATVVIADGVATLLATSEETTEWGNLWPGSAPETIMWWDLEITDEDAEAWQMTAPSLFVVVHQVTR
jgi:hypothetical protein